MQLDQGIYLLLEASSEGCLNAGSSVDEIMEAIQIGVIGGGSITYPNARFAMKVLEEFTSEE